MTCPTCGKEMEPGWLYCRAPLLWSPKQGKATLFLGREDVNLVKDGFPAAFACRNCRRIILEY